MIRGRVWTLPTRTLVFLLAVRSASAACAEGQAVGNSAETKSKRQQATFMRGEAMGSSPPALVHVGQTSQPAVTAQRANVWTIRGRLGSLPSRKNHHLNHHSQ